MTPSAQHIREASKALRQHFPEWDAPRALVQLGSGFDPQGLLDETHGTVAMAALGLTHERRSPAAQPLTMTLGRVGATQVLVAHGHRYRYEEPDSLGCVLPVAAAALARVGDIILVESGVSLREDLKPGTWMVATDYINAMGVSPLDGCLDLVEHPFVDMADAFSQTLNAEIINAAARVGLGARLGIYQGTCGPQFDTPAEAEAARRNGADVLGNAVVPETVVGALFGCRVAALVLTAEVAASYRGRRLKQSNILDAARFCSADMMRALNAAIRENHPDEGIPA